MKEQRQFSEQEKLKKLQEIQTLKESKLRENGIDDFTGTNKIWKIITYFCLSLALVLMISYSIQTVIKSKEIWTQLTNIIGTLILSIFTIFFIFTSLFADSKKGRVFIIIASLLLSCYSGFNLLVGAKFINIGNQKTMIDFFGKDISEVMTWAEENDIFINQIYENSDTIEPYKIIRQDVEAGTPLKNLKRMTVTISDGPNPEAEMTVPNMIGWNIDKVLKYIDTNHLTNVNIEFDFHQEVKRDVIFSQNIESTMKRNERIELKASLGKKDEFQYVTMVDLTGMDEFHATTWLKRNRIAYEIEYGYSEAYEEGKIINQKDKKGKVIDVTKNAKTTITLARNHQITVPNFKEMTSSKISSWATDNKIKINFEEEYDEKIAKGKVIESSRLKGDTVEVGDTIKIIISKGPLYMIKFTTIEEITKWANENDIPINIEYQFNTSIKPGELIASSHEENQLVKNTDTIHLIISQGGTTKVPNFGGMTKSEIEKACKNANLLCEYKYESNPEIEKDKIIKQSMRAESEVLIGATITITLSNGS